VSIFYIKTLAGDLYSLDATTTFNFSEAGSLTEYTIESGAKVSDHYVNENKTFNLSGVITDFKTKSSLNKRTTEEFIGGLLSLKRNKEAFKLYYRGSSEEDSETFFDNVMMTNITFSQDSDMGTSQGKYAYKVDLQLKQVTFSTRATVSMGQAIATKSEKKTVTSATTGVVPDPKKVAQEKIQGELPRLRQEIKKAEGKIPP